MRLIPALHDCNTLQHIATHCEIPQDTETHCKTLQDTARQCKQTVTGAGDAADASAP